MISNYYNFILFKLFDFKVNDNKKITNENNTNLSIMNEFINGLESYDLNAFQPRLILRMANFVHNVVNL